MKVKLTYLVDAEKRFEERGIQEWIERVIQSEGKKLGIIEIIFTSNQHLLEINQEFLEHNYFTDVIAFDNCIKNLVQGDIYISLEQVMLNSDKYKVTNEQELLRVMIHGVLHLIGYQDVSKKKKAIMNEKENQYIHLAKTMKNRLLI